jgi:hypothetical protein
VFPSHDHRGDNLWDNLRANLWDNLGDKNLNFYSTYIYGQFDSYFPGYYRFPEKHLGIKYDEERSKDIKAWEDICKSAGFCYTFENICFVCDRPSILSINDEGFLHSEDGPCMEFRDGYKFYAENGAVFPNWIAESPDKINVETIKSEDNIEIRRIMINRMGIDKYLQETNAEVLDFEVGERTTRALIKEPSGNAYLCGHDGSTDRVYYMSVDPNSNGCREAHESICDLDESLCIAEA